MNKENNNNIFIVENNLSEKEELNNINDKILNNNKNITNEEIKKDKLFNFGRKKQESGEIGIHNKSCKDNIINKTKANFFNEYKKDLIKFY